VLGRFGSPPAIDPASVAFYLVLGYVPPPRTMWRGVWKLPAGWRGSVAADGSVAAGPIVEPPAETAQWDKPLVCGQEGLSSVVPEAVARCLPTDGPVGVMPGFDGHSVVLAGMATDAEADCQLLHLPPPDPSGLLGMLADCDEPVAAPSAIGSCCIAAAADGLPVLSGEGAELVFACAFRHLAMRFITRLSPWRFFSLRVLGWKGWPVVPPALRRQPDRLTGLVRLLDEVPAMQYLHLSQRIAPDQLGELMERDFAAAAKAEQVVTWFCDAYEQNDYDEESTYGQRLDLHSATFYVDPPGSDIRRPMLSPEVTALGLSMPREVRSDQHEEWLALRGIFNPMPPKAEPPPIAEWLRGDLAETLRESLLEGELVCRDWLRRPVMERLIDAHLEGADHSRELWTLLLLGEWLRARS
jgi:asparagine synthase (glutamine-hydrolysing)